MERIKLLCKDRPGLPAYPYFKDPLYYTKGSIETWDFINEKKLDYLEGNVVKYIVRWKDKNGIEDLYKAREYINKKISLVEQENKK